LAGSDHGGHVEPFTRTSSNGIVCAAATSPTSLNGDFLGNLFFDKDEDEDERQILAVFSAVDTPGLPIFCVVFMCDFLPL
jgi:hypothetical protein